MDYKHEAKRVESLQIQDCVHEAYQSVNMEEILLQRLLKLAGEIKRNSDMSLTLNSGCDEECHKAQIVQAKLKTLLERINNDLNNYFRLVNNPSADDVSQISEIQLEAEQNLAELEVKINIFKITNSNSNKETVTSKLPKLSLPEFDGDVLSWFQFWDQFNSNIHNKNMADVEKLLYLKASVKGEAKRAIDGLETTNKNYNIAINTLRDRYGNTSHLIDAHYAALSRVQPADKTISTCRKTLNDLERHLRVLESLKEDVNHSHLRHLIFEKFPEDLIYELKLKTTSDSISEIRKHLEIILTAREDAYRITKDKTPKTEYTVETLHSTQDKRKLPQSSKGESSQSGRKERRPYEEKGFKGKNTAPTFNKARNLTQKRNLDERKEDQQRPTENIDRKRKKLSCIFCSKDHYNDQCRMCKTVEDRKSKLRNRCYACLREGHSIRNCKTKRMCGHCKEYGHNRALCPVKFSNREQQDVAPKDN